MRKIAVPLILILMGASILVTAGAPKFLEKLNRKRVNYTMDDMRMIATALEARAIDLDAYFPPRRDHAPTSAAATDFVHANVIRYEDLERELIPTYARKLPPRTDEWGNAFEIRAGSYDKGSAQSYAIRSRGRDGKADAQQYAFRLTKSFDEDLVISDGNFVWYPEWV